jgi:hypothetical protein
MSAIARIVTPGVRLEVIKEDADDNRILECAGAAGSDYIVRRQGLAAARYDSMRILTAASSVREPNNLRGRR